MKHPFSERNNKEGQIVAVLLIVALLVRIIAVIFWPQSAPDTDRYDNTALNLISGKGFSSNGLTLTADSAPLYPLFLAGIYKIWGHNLVVVRIIQAVIDTITCLLIYLLAIRVFARRKLARLALLISVFYPSLVASTTFILTETLYTSLLTASVLCMVLSLSKESWFGYIFAGILLGIATLCRPTTLLFPFFLIFGLTLTKSGKKVIGGMIICLMMVMTIAPWTVRNYIVFGRFLPVAIGAGGNLWLGSYIPWDADYRYQDLTDKKKIEKGLSALDADDKLKEEAIKNIKEHPFVYMRLCFKKIWRFWFLIPGRKELLKNKMLLRVTIHLIYLTVLFFFILGVWFLRKQKDVSVLPILFMILYFTLIHSLLFAIPRYRIPITPLVIVFAAAGVQVVYKAYKSGKISNFWVK